MSSLVINEPTKPPWYRDVRVLNWVFQISVFVIVLLVVRVLYNNAISNLNALGVSTDFGFLTNGTTGFAIPGIEDSADFTRLEGYFAGFLNTFRIILVGIPLCTALGIVIGIARLSDNLMVRALGTIYVETFRNVPVLLWIFFIYLIGMLESLPPISDEVTPLGITVVSNRGIAVPFINPESNRSLLLAFIGLGILAAVLISRWRTKVNEETGQPSRGLLFGIIGFLVVVGVGSIFAGNSFALTIPEIDGRRITGGIEMTPPYFGLLLALVLYTASHVAEIVRGAIQSVHKGQGEAADAIALTTFQRYRFVILPQAFRVAIPPLASQYLNITKNSSLAVAVGYVELTSIFGRYANNAAPALQAVIVLMGFYLFYSLSISAVANFFNRRLTLETR